MRAQAGDDFINVGNKRRDNRDDGFFGTAPKTNSATVIRDGHETQLTPLQFDSTAPKKKSHILVNKRVDGANVSTVVCNHIGFHDIINLVLSPLHPSFTPKIELRDAPLIGIL
jgi:hypothetical protein